jgi:hypothetical protein
MPILGGKRKMKPTICLDFDGVFNNYKGYDGDNLGTPRPNIKKFLQVLHKDFYVVVFSARRYSMIIKWLNDNGLWDYVDNVTSYKLPAICYVDDRGITFNGDYEETLKQIYNFKTWWEK